MPALLEAPPLVSYPPAHDHDQSIQERTLGLLRSSGYGSLARLDCQVADGVIVLAGQVPTFFLKQMAQAVVMRIQNARGIRNEVRVAWVFELAASIFAAADDTGECACHFRRPAGNCLPLEQ